VTTAMSFLAPGVYREDVFPGPAGGRPTGVPAFLGLAAEGPPEAPRLLTLATQFATQFGGPVPGGYLAYAVHGYFQNGGDRCYVIRVAAPTEAALRRGLAALAPLDDFDLVSAPDVMHPLRPDDVRPDLGEAQRQQAALLEYCDRGLAPSGGAGVGGRAMVLLDAPPGADPAGVLRARDALRGTNGALYYPWVRVQGGPEWSGGFVPPSGHVAGVYARSDRQTGVHKAPANEGLHGVLDVEAHLTDAEQAALNPRGVNCLRVFPGRGIRVWGARTLSREPAWTYVSVRRVFLTVARWVEGSMAGAAFEPQDARRWARLSREVTAYLYDLFQRGALRGSTPGEAFYVKCDAETNPPDVRALGQVVTEVGVAPAVPNEFVVVRIVHGAGGVTITGLDESGQ